LEPQVKEADKTEGLCVEIVSAYVHCAKPDDRDTKHTTKPECRKLIITS